MKIIRATIDRVEAELAILKTTDGEELIIPVRFFSGGSEGKSVQLVILEDSQGDVDNEKLAKKIINEIIK